MTVFWRTKCIVDERCAQHDAYSSCVCQHQHKQQAQTTGDVQPIHAMGKFRPFEEKRIQPERIEINNAAHQGDEGLHF